MQVIYNDSGNIAPFKTLKSAPDWINAHKDLKRARFVDIGTLNNLHTFMKHAQTNDYKASSEKLDSGGWAGTRDYDGYLELLKHGDLEVMKSVKDATQKSIKDITKKYQETIANYKFDVTGEFFDVGLVLTGVPETWLQPDAVEEEVTRIELLIDGGFRGGVNFKEIQKNGGRIMGMVSILENHGIEVEIRMTNGVTGWGDYNKGYREPLITSFLLKGYDEPINYKKISSVLSPTYVRRGAFKLRETLANCESVTASMGSSMFLDGHIKLSDTKSINQLEERLFNKGK